MLALGLLLPMVGAQDAEAHFKKLSAELKAEQDVQRDGFRRVAATADYKATLKKLRANEGDRDELISKLNAMRADVKGPDMGAYREKFAAGAAKYAATDGAVPFLVWLATRGGPSVNKDAIDTILAKHAGSSKLGTFIQFMPNMTRMGFSKDEVRAACAKVIAANSHPEIKAGAYYARAQTYRGGRRNPKPAEKDQAAYDADIEACVKTAPGSLIAKRAVAPKFEEERLQIGMEAPDIVGKDIDGVAFKLSDYRGKVVVIDFWGDW